MSLLDVFFPKYCVVCKVFGSYLCANCFAQLSFDTHLICLVCGKGSIDGLTHPLCRKKDSIEGVFCALSYNNIAKKLIYAFKYQPYVSDIQHVLLELFYESLIQKEVLIKEMTEDTVCVPIPLSNKKLRQRGYNQSWLLAKGLAKKFSLPSMDMLERAKETKPQFNLPRIERKANMKDAFCIKRGKRHMYTTALLIDDVVTSGSTLSEATKTLKQNGFQKVWGVTLARD